MRLLPIPKSPKFASAKKLDKSPHMPYRSVPKYVTDIRTSMAADRMAATRSNAPAAPVIDARRSRKSVALGEDLLTRQEVSRAHRPTPHRESGQELAPSPRVVAV